MGALSFDALYAKAQFPNPNPEFNPTWAAKMEPLI
jgi:hypothetical protein